MQKKGLFSLVVGLCVGCCSVLVYDRYLEIVDTLNNMPAMTSHLTNAAHGVHNIGYPTGNHESPSIDYSIAGTSYFFQLSEQNEPEDTLSELGKPDLDPSVDKDFVNYLKRNDFDPRLNATILNSKVRILCFSITPLSQLHTAEKQLKTWGKHCDKFVILTSGGKHASGDIAVINLPDGPTHAWSRLKSSLEWCLQQDLNSYDWVVKIEYDTYLIVENLRYMLMMHSTSIKDYIGQVFAGKQNRGSTIAISRVGLTKLSTVLKTCESDSGGRIDDAELRNCFNHVNVYRREDGRDYTGENRFQLLIPSHGLPVSSAKFVVWYWRFIKHPGQKLPDCCSDYAISYMYASPNNMYLLEYMVYHMRPYGIGYYNCPAGNDAR